MAPLTLRMLRFGTAGTAGFLVDTAVVYALRAPLGLYGAGAVSYLVAASVVWLINRRWTFRDRAQQPPGRQWTLFLAVNLVGFTLNRGCYAALIATVPVCARMPVLAVAAGAIAGMGVNFMLAQRVVFAERTP